MELHILDIIMYFVILILFWYLLDKVSNGESTQGFGGFVGLFWLLIITIIYIILFGVIDWNWIDIFRGINLPDLPDLKL